MRSVVDERSHIIILYMLIRCTTKGLYSGGVLRLLRLGQHQYAQMFHRLTLFYIHLAVSAYKFVRITIKRPQAVSVIGSDDTYSIPIDALLTLCRRYETESKRMLVQPSSPAAKPSGRSPDRPSPFSSSGIANQEFNPKH